MAWKYWDSEHWINRSREMRQKYPKCYCCGSNSTCTHHRHYNSVGAEKDEDLITLCHPCHNSIEAGVDRELWTRMDGHKHWKSAIQKGEKRIIALAESRDYKKRGTGTGKKKRKKAEARNWGTVSASMRRLTRAVKRGDWEAAKVFSAEVSEILDTLSGKK